MSNFPRGFKPLIAGSQPHHMVLNMIDQGGSVNQVSCRCGVILGEVKTLDGAAPCIALIREHQAAVAE